MEVFLRRQLLRGENTLRSSPNRCEMTPSSSVGFVLVVLGHYLLDVDQRPLFSREALVAFRALQVERTSSYFMLFFLNIVLCCVCINKYC